MAVELDPADPLMRLSLAMAQDRAGNPRAALPELEAALELDPELAQAHYVLGTLLERSGRDEEAIDRFTAAAARDPLSAEVQLRLADALRRTGRVEASLAGYRRTLEIDAGAEGARFGEGMALVRLGRHREARERLESALGRTAGHPLFATALARLLAASPDARVRDGRRAFELVEVVVAEHKTTDVAETMAMALAELGEFRGAMEWQQLAIDVATDAGRPDVAARMSDNLARYRRGEPCRTPWRDDAPEHRPGPAVEPGLLGAGPTS
jgi:tetratricopeptide (TPR) repeat protein